MIALGVVDMAIVVGNGVEFFSFLGIADQSAKKPPVASDKVVITRWHHPFSQDRQKGVF
jgi:hypothetical protein